MGNVNECRTTLIKNLIKESFYGKRKKKKAINVLTAFFISHKSDVKTFLKWILNQCRTALVNMTLNLLVLTQNQFPLKKLRINPSQTTTKSASTTSSTVANVKRELRYLLSWFDSKREKRGTSGRAIFSKERENRI